MKKGGIEHKRVRPGLSATQRAMQQSPCDPALYVALGKEMLGLGKPQARLAQALFRTARFLDPGIPGIDELIASAAGALSPVLTLSPPVYERNRAIADELARLKPSGSPCTVVDVGGGRGHLAQFLDAHDDYFLAEPNVNGIIAQAMPLPDRAADFAVSCHVLEHVPPAERGAFLDGMARIARKAVVVLVPVEIGGETRVTHRLNFFIKLIGAKWARDHLECGHPTPDSMGEYARSRGYSMTAVPVGNSSASAALLLVHHYAELAGRTQDHGRINRFFNEHYTGAAYQPPESDQYLFTFVLK
jgi:hypothetical protein